MVAVESRRVTAMGKAAQGAKVREGDEAQSWELRKHSRQEEPIVAWGWVEVGSDTRWCGETLVGSEIWMKDARIPFRLG